VSLAGRIAIIVGAVALGVGLSLSGAATAQAATQCAPDSGANFAGATPSVKQLSDVSLRCADFQGSNLSNLSFEQTDLRGADFRHATVTKSDFTQSDLTDADFTDATLTGTSFDQATMSGVTLTGIKANGADFEQVGLTGVSLKGAQLVNADLSQASLKHADLSNADLRGASLDQADLSGANLRGADLAGADLTETTTTNTVSSGVGGLPPLDLFAAVIALIVALLVLRPRLGRRGQARGGAWLVVFVMAAITAVQAVAAVGWQPTGNDVFVLPFLTPVVFVALWVGRTIRRFRDGWPSVPGILVALVGFYVLVAAGLAFLTDTLFGLFPFADSCSSVICGYGAVRGPLGIVIGIVLIIVSAILARLKSLARPAPNLARWEAMQAGVVPGAGMPAPTASFPAANPGPSSKDQGYGPPPSQTI
jgi:uncharacterized protein YjbI with pentapeptide repeats